MVDMTRWLDLVECEVAPVGSNFIPQELTRQRPVVDHCVPGSGDGDYDMDIGQTAIDLSKYLICNIIMIDMTPNLRNKERLWELRAIQSGVL